MPPIGLFLVQIFVSAIIMFLIALAVAHWRHFRRLRNTPMPPRTAFTTAVLQNDVDFVRAALESGMDANTRLLDTPEFDQADRLISRLSLERHLLAPTPLIVSASLGYIEMANILLEFGADLYLKNGINKLGSNALYTAAYAGHREMMALFLRRSGLNSIRGSDFESAIISAASAGQNAVISLLLEHGADVNIRDDFDTTLTAAAASGHDTTVNLLLKRGANVNLATSDGETPLMAAVDINRFSAIPLDYLEARLRVVDLLITAGAELNTRDHEGRTALWWAKKPQLHARLKAAGATK
ncbi:MAG: ankyrin [Chthonomonadaceae bacterium]|nr:ankyrin [Chthonomonadaceae bacterium]